MNFWKDGFSIDETKMSIMVLLLFLAFSYVIYADIANNYIFTDNIFDVIKWLIAGVAGVNGVSAIGGYFGDTSDRM